MNQRFIVISTDGVGGYFGIGNTLADAHKNCKGSKTKRKAYCFTSTLPFCPVTEKREATEQEADAWVDRYGGMNWVRCERKEVAI